MPLLVDVRQLRVINELVTAGAENVAASLGTLAGVETVTDVKALTFVDPADLSREIGSEPVYSSTIDLTEPPYGSFVMTFPEETAETVAELVAGRPVDGDLTDLHESALQETCNISTSGFVDGIANVLGTTITIGTPDLRFTDGETLLETRLSHVSDEHVAIVLDSTIRVPAEDCTLAVNLYLVPAPGSFVNLLDCIDTRDYSLADTAASEPVQTRN